MLLELLKNQLLSPDTGAEGGAEATEPTTEPTAEETIKFNPDLFKGQKEFDDFISSKASKAIETYTTKTLPTLLEKERSKWESESKMSAEEKAQAQYKAELESIAQEKAALSRERMTLFAGKQLNKIGIEPTDERVAFVLGDDEDTITARATQLQALIKEQAEKAIKDFKGTSAKAPQAGETAKDPLEKMFESVSGSPITITRR